MYMYITTTMRDAYIMELSHIRTNMSISIIE